MQPAPINFTRAVERLCGRRNVELLREKGILPLAVAVVGSEFLYPPLVADLFRDPDPKNEKNGPLARFMREFDPAIREKRKVIESDALLPQLLLCFARSYEETDVVPSAVLREAALVTEPLTVEEALACRRPTVPTTLGHLLNNLLYYQEIGLVKLTAEGNERARKVIVSNLVRQAFIEEDKADQQEGAPLQSMLNPMYRALFHLQNTAPRRNPLTLTEYWSRRFEE